MNYEKLVWVAIAAALYIAADHFGIPKLEGLAGLVMGGAVIKSDGLLRPGAVR